MTLPECRTPVRIRSRELEVHVVPHGATLHRLVVLGLDHAGRDVVLGHADTGRIGLDPGYLGASVGRYANRLAEGRFEVDGRSHQVTPNEGSHALHGGRHGIDDRCWVVSDRTSHRVELRLSSEDGDQGFPGRLEITATYEVAGPALTITYRAVSDAPTPVNLTNHAYLNLSGEPTVGRHLLSVPAASVTEVDDELIPTGALLAVGGTALDLERPRLLAEIDPQSHEQLAIAGGLDHCYVLSSRSERGSGLRPAAVLRVDDLELLVLTDQPAVQVYAGGQLDGSTTGLRGVPYGPGAGIALECQNYPDAPNHPHFPDSVLRPGQAYTATTCWRFSILGSPRPG